jgi:heme-degrading monooxygenase HmoA
MLISENTDIPVFNIKNINAEKLVDASDSNLAYYFKVSEQQLKSLIVRNDDYSCLQGFDGMNNRTRNYLLLLTHFRTEKELIAWTNTNEFQASRINQKQLHRFGIKAKQNIFKWLTDKGYIHRLDFETVPFWDMKNPTARVIKRATDLRTAAELKVWSDSDDFKANKYNNVKIDGFSTTSQQIVLDWLSDKLND